MKKTLVLVLALALCDSMSLSAQSRTRIWVAAGYGDAAGDWEGDLDAFVVQAVYQQGHTHLALRSVQGSGGYTSDPSYQETSALYGRVLLGGLGHASVASGPSVVQVCENSDSCVWTIGLPLVVEAALRPIPVVGVGVQAFANVNGKRSFRGLLLFLQAGWIPYR